MKECRSSLGNGEGMGKLLRGGFQKRLFSLEKEENVKKKHQLILCGIT